MQNVTARLLRARSMSDVEIELVLDGDVNILRHYEEGSQYVLAANGEVLGYGSVWSPNRSEHEWTWRYHATGVEVPVMLTLVRKYTFFRNKVEVVLRVSGRIVLNEVFSE